MTADGDGDGNGSDDSDDARADPPTLDELAGVAELFGGLTRAELRRAFNELAFKRGETIDPAAFDRAVADAVAAYALAHAGRDPVPDPDLGAGGAVDADADGDTGDRDDDPVLIAGPAAFPTLPPRAEDLPHIMDVPERSVDREAVAVATRDRIETAAEAAAAAGDEARARDLLDVCYDFEVWTPLDADDARATLDAVLQD